MYLHERLIFMVSVKSKYFTNPDFPEIPECPLLTNHGVRVFGSPEWMVCVANPPPPPLPEPQRS